MNYESASFWIACGCALVFAVAYILTLLDLYGARREITRTQRYLTNATNELAVVCAVLHKYGIARNPGPMPGSPEDFRGSVQMVTDQCTPIDCKNEVRVHNEETSTVVVARIFR